ncbi:MAG TPA: GNAT family N-acetyltransferase [Nevskiaceae bacterium]|nr:GNAT family N-acetyltransferase [Nevskiaceae bacterium]
MRHELWPEANVDELRREVEAFFDGRAVHLWAVLFAIDQEAGALLGFAELNIRPYAEGCQSNRIAFLEGWYVTPAQRHRGIGAALVKAAERWALSVGCTEFASDTQADNALGRTAHLGVGFEEIEVIRCFRKPLSGT